jgi:hypothetical protein
MDFGARTRVLRLGAIALGKNSYEHADATESECKLDKREDLQDAV